MACGDGREYVRPAHLRALEAAGLTPVAVSGATPEDRLDELAMLAAAIYLPGSDYVPEDLARARAGETAAAAAAGLPADPLKVRADLALLDRAAARDLPALGVCGGMQVMALLAGGRLATGTPAQQAMHADGARHAIVWGGRAAEVGSWHRQVVADPGALGVVGRAPDGTIEAVADPGRRVWLGGPWHPPK